jgi:CHAT domain-containing protein
VDERGAPSAVASVLTAGGKAAIYHGRQPFAARAVDEITTGLAQEGLSAAAAPALGTRIAELVLEPGIREILARETAPPGERVPPRPLVVVHDAPMSRIPWEALRLGEAVPALAGGLTHRYDGGLLSVAKWRDERSRTPGLDMLLVVNPTEDLSGAEAEGARIEALFGRRPGIRLTVLRGRQARRNELLHRFSSGDFDVVHYAGHAFFDPVHRSRSGIVCHGGEVLSGADLAGLAQLPALVFFNACEAARVRRPGQAQRPGEETVVQGTIGFAEAFLMGGVANYLGTYWPVGDDPAKAFAEAFYGALLAGEPLGGALLKGRQAALDTGSGDWADYVLYGDPGFLLTSAE